MRHSNQRTTLFTERCGQKPRTCDFDYKEILFKKLRFIHYPGNPHFNTIIDV